MQSGYTLIEMMFVSIIIIWVVGALFTAQLVGFRIGQLVDSKSGASDASRKALQQLVTDIRSCKMWNIGSLSGTNFTGINSGVVQGSALQLCQTTNGSQFTIYYFITNSVNNGVLMQTSVANWNPVIVCSNLLDNLYFTAESYNGQIQTNSITNVNSYKNIIHATLDFCQFQYPLTQVGTNGLYDFYKLDIRATPHLPE
jgi:type II secretory pathway pseudopilin PulG